MPTFENVVPALSRALAARGFEALTAVQSAVLSPDVQSEDLVVSAQTGSGKTVAFGLTLANTLLDGHAKLEQPGARKPSSSRRRANSPCKCAANWNGSTRPSAA